MEKEIGITPIKMKFRRSKEWKEKRKAFIEKKGGVCEVCGKNERLTPAHKNINVLLEGEEGNFNCQIYNSSLYLEEGFPEKLKERVYNWFMKWYKDFDSNCMLLCNGCHIQQTNGHIICNVCKKKFHKPLYKTCWECNPNKEEIEMKKKINELEGELWEEEDFEHYPKCDLCGKDYFKFVNKEKWEEIYDLIPSVMFCEECSKNPERINIVKKKEKDRRKKIREHNKPIKKKIKQIEKERGVVDSNKGTQ